MFTSRKLIFLFLCAYTFNYSLAGSLSCNVRNNLPLNPYEEIIFVEGDLNITYDRNELRVYKYKSSDLVNVLINDVEVKFYGKLRKDSSEITLQTKNLRTIIEGIAVLTENNTLDYCDLDLKTKQDGGRHDTILQDNLFYLSKSCIEQQLCEQLDKVIQDDFLRANILPHNFGDNSVLYNQVGQKLPKMLLPKNNKLDILTNLDNSPASLQKTINIILDVLLAILIRQVSGPELGKIVLPELNQPLSAGSVKGGHFILTGGTFGDLKNIIRTENFGITNNGLQFSIQLGFQFPKAQLQFKHYDFKYLILKKEGNATITIDSVTLGLKVTIDFNRFPCFISVDYVRSRVEGIDFALSGGGIIDSVINKVVNMVVHKFARNIVSFIKLKLKEAISRPLELFDCNKYRP